MELKDTVEEYGKVLLYSSDRKEDAAGYIP